MNRIPRAGRHHLAALAAALALAAASCATRAATSSREPATAGSAELEKPKLRKLQEVPFERSWDLKLPHAVHASWIGPEVPDVIFFQVEQTNEIYAVDAMSGHTRWVSIPLPKPITLTPHVHREELPGPQPGTRVYDDRLYLVSDDVLYCFDLAYGQVIWRYQLPYSASSGPTAIGVDSDVHVFLGDWTGRLEAVGMLPTGLPYGLWQWNLHAPVTSNPTEREALVYAADQEGAMSCFGLDRKQVWSFQAGNHCAAGSVRGRTLYFGTGDDVFYAVNRLSGQRLGTVFLGAPIRRQPLLFVDEPERVYVWTDDRDRTRAGLHALRARADVVPFQDPKKHALEVERMAQDWFYPGVDALISSSPDHLFLTARGSNLVQAVDRVTGTLDWAWDIGRERDKRNQRGDIVHITEYQDPGDGNRSIFTADGDGRIVAYRLFGFAPKERVATNAKLVQQPATR